MTDTPRTGPNSANPRVFRCLTCNSPVLDLPEATEGHFLTYGHDFAKGPAVPRAKPKPVIAPPPSTAQSPPKSSGRPMLIAVVVALLAVVVWICVTYEEPAEDCFEQEQIDLADELTAGPGVGERINAAEICRNRAELGP
ncbi:hypothetical protein [Streptomyces sp. NPDC127098]|uniref:hypothetical protein n=1 Tax=Streptomyces sp. NPDC127098 TaxID=3347137 RepID=UPI00365EF48E